MSVIIRLQNLPWSASALDIRQFFSGLKIPDGGVHIIGGDKGDAFIAFSTDEDARQAMMKNGGKIGESTIQLFLSSKTEMQTVIAEAKEGQAAPEVMPPYNKPMYDPAHGNYSMPATPKENDRWNSKEMRQEMPSSGQQQQFPGYAGGNPRERYPDDPRGGFQQHGRDDSRMDPNRPPDRQDPKRASFHPREAEYDNRDSRFQHSGQPAAARQDDDSYNQGRQTADRRDPSEHNVSFGEAERRANLMHKEPYPGRNNNNTSEQKFDSHQERSNRKEEPRARTEYDRSYRSNERSTRQSSPTASGHRYDVNSRWDSERKMDTPVSGYGDVDKENKMHRGLPARVIEPLMGDSPRDPNIKVPAPHARPMDASSDQRSVSSHARPVDISSDQRSVTAQSDVDSRHSGTPDNIQKLMDVDSGRTLPIDKQREHHSDMQNRDIPASRAQDAHIGRDVRGDRRLDQKEAPRTDAHNSQRGPDMFPVHTSRPSRFDVTTHGAPRLSPADDIDARGSIAAIVTPSSQAQVPEAMYQNARKPNDQNVNSQPSIAGMNNPPIQTSIGMPMNPADVTRLQESRAAQPGFQQGMAGPGLPPRMQAPDYQMKVGPIDAPHHEVPGQHVRMDAHVFQPRADGSALRPRMDAPGFQPRMVAPGFQPRMEAPGHQPRMDGPGMMQRSEAPGFQQPRMEAPGFQGRIDSPVPPQRMEAPGFHPRMESPGSQQKMESSGFQPRMDAPGFRPRMEAPGFQHRMGDPSLRPRFDGPGLRSNEGPWFEQRHSNQPFPPEGNSGIREPQVGEDDQSSWQKPEEDRDPPPEWHQRPGRPKDMPEKSRGLLGDAPAGCKPLFEIDAGDDHRFNRHHEPYEEVDQYHHRDNEPFSGNENERFPPRDNERFPPRDGEHFPSNDGDWFPPREQEHFPPRDGDFFPPRNNVQHDQRDEHFPPRDNERFPPGDERFPPRDSDRRFSQRDRRFPSRDEAFPPKDQRFPARDERFPPRDQRFPPREGGMYPGPEGERIAMDTEEGPFPQRDDRHMDRGDRFPPRDNERFSVKDHDDRFPPRNNERIPPGRDVDRRSNDRPPHRENDRFSRRDDRFNDNERFQSRGRARTPPGRKDDTQDKADHTATEDTSVSFREQKRTHEQTNSIASRRWICISGMPTNINYRDVRRFFTGMDIPRDGLKLINDQRGQRTGIAYVQFYNYDSYKSALRKHGEYMDTKYVSIRDVSMEEFDKAIDSYLPSQDERDDFKDEKQEKEATSAKRPRGDVTEPPSTNYPTKDEMSSRSQSSAKRPRGDAGDKDSLCLYVRGLATSSTAEDIKKLFSGVRICKGGEAIFMEKGSTGNFAGRAYMEVETGRDQRTALGFDGKRIGPHSLKISIESRLKVDSLIEKEKAQIEKEKAQIEKEKAQRSRSGDQKDVSKTSATDQKKPQEKPQDKGKASDARDGSTSNKDKSSSYCCVHLQSLPSSVTYKDIKDFFTGLEIAQRGIQIVYSKEGKSTGDAFVEFISKDACHTAAQRSNKRMGAATVKVVAISKEEMLNLLKQHRQAATTTDAKSPPSQTVKNVRPTLLPAQVYHVRAQNLPPNVAIGEIMHFFNGYEPVPDSIRLHYTDDGRPTGNALIGFASMPEVQRVVRDLNGKYCRARPINLIIA